MREIEPYSTPKLTVWALTPLRLPQIKFPRIQIQKLFYKSSWTPQRNHKTLKQLGLKSFQCSLDSYMHCNLDLPASLIHVYQLEKAQIKFHGSSSHCVGNHFFAKSSWTPHSPRSSSFEINSTLCLKLE